MIKYVMTSKSSAWCLECVMKSKSMSRRQKYVMTSIRSSWWQKRSLWWQKLYVIMSKAREQCYATLKSSRTDRNTHRQPVGRRGRCVKRRRRTPADPGSIPGAGDKDKGLISLPCNIRRCALRGWLDHVKWCCRVPELEADIKEHMRTQNTLAVTTLRSFRFQFLSPLVSDGGVGYIYSKLNP